MPVLGLYYYFSVAASCRHHSSCKSSSSCAVNRFLNQTLRCAISNVQCICYMPLRTVGSWAIMFHGCPSGCTSCLFSISTCLTPILHDATALCRYFSETLHKCSSCQWALLNRFSRSEVKGQGHMCECCNGGDIHFDGVHQGSLVWFKVLIKNLGGLMLLLYSSNHETQMKW